MIPSRFEYQFIESSESLLSELAASHFESTGWLAVDAERASGFRYFQRAYLIQFHFENGVTWLIDPHLFDEGDAGRRALNELTQALPRNWILHAATQDFPCLFELGLRPERVFDTELAAKLIGLEKVGLASILQQLHGIELAKEHSAADWSQRPLTASMLGYAALDVQHLHELKESLSNAIFEVGREEWAVQEFDHLLTFAPKPPDEYKWLRLPGVKQARDQTVSKIAKAIWSARELLAQELDISPGRILPDSSIAAAAIAKPSSRRELASNKAFSGRMSRTKLDLWWGAVESAESQDVHVTAASEAIPHHRSWERRFPDAYRRYGELRPILIDLAAKHGLRPEVLISPDAIRSVAFAPPDQPKALEVIFDKHRVRQWQRLEVAPTILEWLAQEGQAELS